MGVRSVSTSVVAILIGPHCRPYLGKDLCRIHERLDISFLKLKSVRSCALILKPNSVSWWERAHLCVRARLCVCACVCGVFGCVCVCVSSSSSHYPFSDLPLLSLRLFSCCCMVFGCRVNAAD